MDSISNPKDKLKYPKIVWLIVFSELCERFCYYGLRTVLVLYLTTILKFNGDESTIIFHSFVFFAYSMPLAGAILADSYCGKFKTILRLSVVYALGSLILTSSSMSDMMISLNTQKLVAVVGLLLISIGTGGIKPSVYLFGGDQFQLPHQKKQLEHYTTKFMIAINLGALVSTFLIPELRENVHCFGKDTCYPLAFGVPAVTILISIVVIFSGRNKYVNKKPENNVISRTFGCIFYALRKKLTSSNPEKIHWLDNAKEVYTETEISNTKKALDVIIVFTAYPIFWALYEQQGSRWTLQATLMDGRLDFLNWTIKPDQMQTLVPFFGLIFLVLFDVVVYPLLRMVGIRAPLQILTLSGLLSCLAFIFAALLQFNIFGNTTVIPTGEGHLHIYNAFDCNVFVRSSSLSVDRIGPLEIININHTAVSGKDNTVGITLLFDTTCTFVPGKFELDSNLTFVEGKTVSYYLTRSNSSTITLNRIGNHDNLIKDKYGYPNLRIFTDYTFDVDDNITLNSANEDSSRYYSISLFRGKNFIPVRRGKYTVFYNGQLLVRSLDLIPATFYTLTIQRNGDIVDIKLFSMDKGNYIHMLWQLPQYICMIMADVIFIVKTTEFACYEAPQNIKSFIIAISLLTTAVGNLLIVLISTLSIQNQAYEYLFYCGFMFADTLLLVYFSFIYQKNSSY